MAKTICEKKIEDTTYTLKHFEGDNRYIIYKFDEKIMKDGKFSRIPEDAIFDNEKDAREYLENLQKNL